MAYTKLFQSILTSTIWVESDRTRIIWITMLALADKNGEVQASIPGLARVAGVPIADCEEAIARFLAPDPYSRTPDDEGRRIEKIDGGWALLNHEKYRRLASKDESKESAAERQRRKRNRDERNGHAPAESVTPCHALSRSVTPCHAPSRSVTENRDIADTDTDSDNTLLSAGADVEAIFQAYPAKRRGGRKEGHKAIVAALRHIQPAQLLDRVKAYAASREVRDKIAACEWNYLPLLATWMNKGRYEQDLTELTAAPPPPAPPPPIPEPPGWREFVASEYPRCDYAPGQPKHGMAWTEIPHADAKVFADAMQRAALRQ